MELNYNVKGERRKQLVKALEEIIGVKSEYMGVPTFVYRIGKVMVDRSGTVYIYRSISECGHCS